MVQSKFQTAIQFYPTNNKGVRLLLEPYKHIEHGKSIFEPNAGKGDILDYVKNKINARLDMYAIELDNDLKNVLKGKGYNVIHDDFLTYDNHLHLDYIFMNPPFKSGTKHLLKAWDIVAEGGDIACILNAETIRNPYSTDRQRLLNIIEQNGSFEYHSNLFSDSERVTDVECAIVHLKKPKRKKEWDFDKDKFSYESKQQIKGYVEGGKEVSDLDYLDSLIRAYGKGIEEFDSMMMHYEQTKMFLKIFETSQYDDFEKIIKESIKEDGNMKNTFVRLIKKNAWRFVISKMDIDKYFTSGVSKKFDEFVRQQNNIEFTRENILEMLEGIFQNRGNIMKEALLEVFDKMCSHDAKNKIWLADGFKTNSAHKVNQKVIIPYIVSYGNYYSASDLKQWGDRMDIRYGDNKQFLGDIDRVLCHLTGKQFPMKKGTSIISVLQNRFTELGKVKTGDKFDSNCESEFFNIRFFKKGTIHLKFKDKKVWEMFNRRVAEYRNWLPEDINN